VSRLISKLRLRLLRFLGIHSNCVLPSSEFYEEIAHRLMYIPRIFGDRGRLNLGRNVVLNDALINTTSGLVTLKDFSFCGHGVCILTGTHDYRHLNFDRQTSVPPSGRDIVINEGAWLGSNVTVIGPCVIGAHSVVAAGSLVLRDVEAYSIYAGVPAKKVKHISDLTS
jgi:acetyltransferase-like isoleucine patch superfamily enzyme